MAMSKERPMGSKEEIVESLKHRATELWGAERVQAIEAVIEQTAEHVWAISQDPPPADEEPGFYL